MLNFYSSILCLSELLYMNDVALLLFLWSAARWVQLAEHVFVWLNGMSSSLGKHWCAAESHGAGNSSGGEAAPGGLLLSAEFKEGWTMANHRELSGKWIGTAWFFGGLGETLGYPAKNVERLYLCMKITCLAIQQGHTCTSCFLVLRECSCGCQAAKQIYFFFEPGCYQDPSR